MCDKYSWNDYRSTYLSSGKENEVRVHLPVNHVQQYKHKYRWRELYGRILKSIGICRVHKLVAFYVKKNLFHVTIRTVSIINPNGDRGSREGTTEGRHPEIVCNGILF